MQQALIAIKCIVKMSAEKAPVVAQIWPCFPVTDLEGVGFALPAFEAVAGAVQDAADLAPLPAGLAAPIKRSLGVALCTGNSNPDCALLHGFAKGAMA